MNTTTHHHVAAAILEGMKWQWLSKPPLSTNPTFTQRIDEDPIQLWKTISDMEIQGVITRLTEEEQRTPGFYSPVFTVPKPGKTERRFIFNLKKLNEHIHCPSFQMERLNDALRLIREGDWLTSIDLTQAYHHVPIHPSLRKYLRFVTQIQDKSIQIFEYTCLPMGMNVSPRLYQKTMKVVIELLRKHQVKCCIYMDDLLLIASSREESIRVTKLASDLLTEAGFLVNREKSETEPSQIIKFLGVMIDTLAMTVTIPNDKLNKTMTKMRDIKERLNNNQPVTTREWASLIGTIGSLRDAIAETRMYLVHLQKDKQAALDKGGWTANMIPSTQGMEELMFWEQHIQDLATNGRTFLLSPHDIVLVTDASDDGYGATIEMGAPLGTTEAERNLQGIWTAEEREEHNNWREFKAAMIAIIHFANRFNWNNRTLQLKSDNQVTLAYLNKLGGRVPNLNQLSIHLHNFCKPRNLTIRAEYIPGIENVIADRLSRHLPSEHSEWELPQTIFNQIENLMGPMMMDLFASATNHKTTRYLTLRPDPAAVGTNAFAYHWHKNQRLYANPPFSLIPRVLQKARMEESNLLLIAPVWPTAIWWPTLCEMMTNWPLILNCQLTSQIHSEKENSWICAAFPISGNTLKHLIFQEKLKNFYRELIPTRRSPWPLQILHGRDSPKSHDRLIFASEQIISSILWSEP